MQNGIEKMKIKFLKCGYCKNIERVELNNGKFKQKEFYALSAFINHKNGNFLFDTGYSSHFKEATKKFPYSLYAKVTPHYVKQEDYLINQLNEEIDYIFISHFHADHIAGIKDFENSKIICSKKEYYYLKNKKGFSALKNGFLPDLLPNNFEERAIFIEDFKEIEFPIKNSGFKKGYDIFNDKSLIAISLFGHTIGQYGLFINGEKKYFLISDAVWNSKAFINKIYPSKITKLIKYDYKEYIKTIEKLNIFYNETKDFITIVPTHDTKLIDKLI